ncbi:hypothetical protein [Lignipirellula cremea]|uniref:Uncharacterized protein n=1 Tax=Lignipirellula cremea TaxID=2528010 RepID=A0A518DNF4_9BACT|nr:hypothetical protein [Lignipirellula cremea]QDU93370.1 hypothetical protein Pla8534_11500 [Lignipirellula cremea]
MTTSPRLRRLRFWLTIGLAIAFLFLAARLAIVVWQTETAVEVLREQWLDRTLGKVFYNSAPVDMRSPKEQTDYWLETIERAHRRKPFDATTAMGAALVLENRAKFSDRREQWEQAARCRLAARWWAAYATQLEPENVDLWRLRARLLWAQCHSLPKAELIQALEDGARHDPQNALYPYLLAMHDREQSGIEGSPLGDRVVAQFEAGQALPVLDFGVGADFACVTFLTAANTPVMVQREILDRRGFPLACAPILEDIANWQQLRVEKASYVDDVPRAIELQRQMLVVLDQFARNSQPARHLLLMQNRKLRVEEEILELQQEAEPSPQDRAASWERFMRSDLIEEILAPHYPNDFGLLGYKSSLRTVYPVVGIEIASSLTFVFLLAGAICLPISAWLRREPTDIRPLGPWRHLLLFSASFLLVFLTYVVAPLRQIEVSLLKGGLLVLLLVMLAASVGRLVWQVWRSGGFRFRLSTLLIVMLLACLLLGGFARQPKSLSELLVFPPEGAMWSRELWHRNLIISNPLLAFWPARAPAYWLGHSAHWLTLAVWLPLLACFVCFQIHKRKQTTGVPVPRREQLAFGLRAAGLAALGWSTVFLFVYLVLAPGVLHQNEEDCQKTMTQFRRTPAEARAYDEVVYAILQEARKVDAKRRAEKRRAARVG